MIKRIAITGPESTGKSTLAEQLAKHYKTVWVPEYAREYIESIDRPYTFEDVEQIALTQIQKERAALKVANKYVFVDTDLIVIKIWMEHSFGKIPDWLEKKIVEQKFDLYLLCYIDLPWEYDEQREHPHDREYFYNKYEEELKLYNFNYSIVSGKTNDRKLQAIYEIQSL